MNQIAETAVWQTCLCSSQSFFVPWTIQCKPCVLLVGGIQFNPYYSVKGYGWNSIQLLDIVYGLQTE